MSPDITERLVPTPTGFSNEVKQKAARAERAWEAASALIGIAGASGTAAIAIGVAIPPLAPFLGLVAGGGVLFKLRAKWAKEDPPRPDFNLVTEYRPPRLDLMAVMPPGEVPRGAAIPTLLHAAGASVEATVICVERVQGASAAARETADEAARDALADRVQEAYDHARRTEMLTASLYETRDDLSGMLLDMLQQSDVYLREAWPERYSGRPFADLYDTHTLGRLIAAGFDERLLAYQLPDQFPLEREQFPSSERAGPPDEANGVRLVIDEAAVAARDFGTSLRQWTWEATLHPSLGRR